MGQLEPVNMPRIIEELEAIWNIIMRLGGRTPIDVSVGMTPETTKDGEKPECDSEEELVGMALEVALRQLQVSQRRLSVLLNDGDVDMMDARLFIRLWLEHAWALVAEISPGPKEFSEVAESIGDDLKSTIDVLKGTRPKYVGGGRVVIGDATVQFTSKSQIAFLEYLCKHMSASGPELEKAGVSNPRKTVKELREHQGGVLADYLEPSGSSKKGYSTTILDGRISSIT